MRCNWPGDEGHPESKTFDFPGHLNEAIGDWEDVAYFQRARALVRAALGRPLSHWTHSREASHIRRVGRTYPPRERVAWRARVHGLCGCTGDGDYVTEAAGDMLEAHRGVLRPGDRLDAGLSRRCLHEGASSWHAPLLPVKTQGSDGTFDGASAGMVPWGGWLMSLSGTPPELIRTPPTHRTTWDPSQLKDGEELEVSDGIVPDLGPQVTNDVVEWQKTGRAPVKTIAGIPVPKDSFKKEHENGHMQEPIVLGMSQNLPPPAQQQRRLESLEA